MLCQQLRALLACELQTACYPSPYRNLEQLLYAITTAGQCSSFHSLNHQQLGQQQQQQRPESEQQQEHKQQELSLSPCGVVNNRVDDIQTTHLCESQSVPLGLWQHPQQRQVASLQQRHRANLHQHFDPTSQQSHAQQQLQHPETHTHDRLTFLPHPSTAGQSLPLIHQRCRPSAFQHSRQHNDTCSGFRTHNQLPNWQNVLQACLSSSSRCFSSTASHRESLSSQDSSQVPHSSGSSSGDRDSSSSSRCSWLQHYLPPAWVPYAQLMRLDKPIGSWLLAWPGLW